MGSGGTIRKERLEQERIAQTRRRTSQSLTPDELVTAHPGNFEIRYSEITSAEITRWLFQSRLRFCVSRPSTAGKTIRFNLQKKQVLEAQRLLELSLLSKIKGK